MSELVEVTPEAAVETPREATEVSRKMAVSFAFQLADGVERYCCAMFNGACIAECHT